MSRVFWFAIGAGSGVYALVKTRRAAQRFTPAGVADQAGALRHGARLFAQEVRAGMTERETQLRERLAISHPGGPDRRALTPSTEQAAKEDSD